MHNTELAMTLLPQTPHGSISLLNSSPSDPFTVTFIFLVLTFKPLLSSASFQFQNLSFKSSMVSLMRTRSSAYNNSLTTLLLAFSVMSTTIVNNDGDSKDLDVYQLLLRIPLTMQIPPSLLSLQAHNCPNHYFW